MKTDLKIMKLLEEINSFNHNLQDSLLTIHNNEMALNEIETLQEKLRLLKQEIEEV
jgi:hypothetical protein